MNMPMQSQGAPAAQQSNRNADVEKAFQQLSSDEKKTLLKAISPEVGSVLKKVLPGDLEGIIDMAVLSTPDQVDVPGQPPRPPASPQPQQVMPQGREQSPAQGTIAPRPQATNSTQPSQPSQPNDQQQMNSILAQLGLG